jgi:homospermidine synthase
MENNRTLVVIGGLGAVASCAVPLIYQEFTFSRVVLLDCKLLSAAKDTKRIPKGAEFFTEQFGPKNYEAILANYLKKDDVCLNLSLIDSRAVMIWCMGNDAMYLNTSGESWAETEDADLDNCTNYRDASLSRIHQKLSKSLANLYQLNPNKKEWAIHVVQHGMDPGLVNQFIKKELQDIVMTLLECPDGCLNSEKIQQHIMDHRDWPSLAQALDIQTIHISEQDTQRSTMPHQWGGFHLTWSIEGFVIELRDYAEIGLRTHKKCIPREAHVFDGKDDVSMTLGGKATNMQVMFWVPSGPIQGFPCPHDESIIMARFLEVRDS